MPVDFYHKSDKKFKDMLFSLDGREFESLDRALSVFKQKTGLTIDQYDDTLLSYEHIQLLIAIMEQQNAPGKPNDVVREVLKKFNSVKYDIIAVGD